MLSVSSSNASSSISSNSKLVVKKKLVAVTKKVGVSNTNSNVSRVGSSKPSPATSRSSSREQSVEVGKKGTVEINKSSGVSRKSVVSSKLSMKPASPSPVSTPLSSSSRASSAAISSSPPSRSASPDHTVGQEEPLKRPRIIKRKSTSLSAPVSKRQKLSPSPFSTPSTYYVPRTLPGVISPVKRDIVGFEGERDVSPCISAFSVVDNKPDDFHLYFYKDWNERDEQVALEIELEYPDGKEQFVLVHPKAGDGYDYHPITEVIEIIDLIVNEFLTEEQALQIFNHKQGSNPNALDLDFLNSELPSDSRSGSPNPSSLSENSINSEKIRWNTDLCKDLRIAERRRNGPKFEACIDRFNTEMRKLKASGQIKRNLDHTEGLKMKVWSRITAQAYERVVGPKVQMLKQYEKFSNNVYGELNSTLLNTIFAQTNLGPGSVFVDMGSGVGNCLVQASLATGCTSYGFENMESYSDIAEDLIKECQARWKLWGLNGGPVTAIRCDMTKGSEVSDVLKKADVVLCNNQVFSPELNRALRDRFLDLKEGSLIVSLQPFRPTDFKLNGGNCCSIEAILKQSKPIEYPSGSVSWTDATGKYFITEVNHEDLKRWMEENSGREERRTRRRGQNRMLDRGSI